MGRGVSGGVSHVERSQVPRDLVLEGDRGSRSRVGEYEGLPLGLRGVELLVQESLAPGEGLASVAEAVMQG